MGKGKFIDEAAAAIEGGQTCGHGLGCGGSLDPKERAKQAQAARTLLDQAVVEALTNPAYHHHVAALVRRELRVKGGTGLLGDTIRSTVAARS